MRGAPSHNLTQIQAAMASNLRWTSTARAGALAVGFQAADVLVTVAQITPAMFYKSMASEKRPGLMQDVYHVPSRVGLLYVKFTDDGMCAFMLLSFKSK